MRFVLFGCIRGCWAELVQKFVPRSRVGIFHNERTRSTPSDSKLKIMVRFILWVYLGPFGCLMKLSAKRAELVQKFVPRGRIGIFRNERTRSIPVDAKLMFWCVLFYLGALRTVWLPYKTLCKSSCHKVV